MTNTPHTSIVVHMITPWGTCKVIIWLQATASIIAWFDYFITVFFADLAALIGKVLHSIDRRFIRLDAERLNWG